MFTASTYGHSEKGENAGNYQINKKKKTPFLNQFQGTDAFVISKLCGRIKFTLYELFKSGLTLLKK